MSAIRYILIFLAIVLFGLFCLWTCPVKADQLLVAKEKFELHSFSYRTDGYKIICHWIQNPKLLGGKVNTGLSCVAFPYTPVEISPLQENKGPQGHNGI